MAAADDKIRFADIADELGLEGDEADEFIGAAMLKKGYRAVTDWMDPEPEAPARQPAGGLFRPSGGTGNAPVKRTAPQATPPRRASGQY